MGMRNAETQTTDSSHASRITQHESVIRHPSSVISSNWKHLRIPYQLTLAPIFLWGYFLASPRPTWSLIPAFVSFHLLLYPGITAYNSYYDRDYGPIGALWNPPPVSKTLISLAVMLKATGFLIALLYGFTLAAIYGAFVALALLSHLRRGLLSPGPPGLRH